MAITKKCGAYRNKNHAGNIGAYKKGLKNQMLLVFYFLVRHFVNQLHAG